MTKTIKSAKDVDGLEFGDQFIIDVGFDDVDHDPEEFADAYIAAAAEINAALEAKFASSGEPVKMNDGTVPDVGNRPFTVEFTDTHAIILSSVDAVVDLGGDIIDRNNVKLKAGKPSKRKLQKNGDGYITINGEKYS